MGRIVFIRTFRQGIMALLLGIGLVTPAGARDGAFPQRNVPPQSLSPVILTERPGAVQEFTVDPQQVRQMVNRALLTLTSASDIGTAWKRLGITPQDVVGIKITTAGGQGMCTHRSLVNAICDGLRAAGMPMSQIIIWDKFQDRMVRAGYAPQAASDSQPMIASVVPSNNYDPDRYYQSQMIGTLIWGDYQFANSINSYNFNERILGRSYYTQYVTRTCTKIVNVPVLSTNEAFGIDACMSSLAFGSVDNFRRFQGPPTYGDPAIPILLDEPYIQHKVVVHILDALVAQCAGGPAFNPQYCQSLGAIYVGRDPVAIDSLALPRIDRMRREMSIPSPGNLSTYVTSAAVLGLGTTDRRRIQFLRVP